MGGTEESHENTEQKGMESTETVTTSHDQSIKVSARHIKPHRLQKITNFVYPKKNKINK